MIDFAVQPQIKIQTRKKYQPVIEYLPVDISAINCGLTSFPHNSIEAKEEFKKSIFVKGMARSVEHVKYTLCDDVIRQYSRTNQRAMSALLDRLPRKDLTAMKLISASNYLKQF